MGVGQNLVVSRLAENASLDAENIHRLFGQKVVWLVPTQDLVDDTPNTITCENCAEIIDCEDFVMHIDHCNGETSVPRQRTIPELFDNLSSENTAAQFVNCEETKNTLATMFPNLPLSKIEDVMRTALTWEDAVDILSTAKEPSCGSEVIKSFAMANLLTSKEKLIEIARDDIWKEALRFYKVALADKTVLYEKLRVHFKNEMGIDVGALSVEYFNKFFESVKTELFEVDPSTKFLIPKRSGGNLTLFKILGVAIGHSLIQGGPPFPFMHPWCYLLLCNKSEDEIVSAISSESYKNLIPLNAGTANVISFLNGLNSCVNNDDINHLFGSAEGAAYEQIVNSTQWPISTTISMLNIETLKSMIIWEELVVKREKQINALREGLNFVGLFSLLVEHSNLLVEFFVPTDKQLTPAVMLNLVEWNDVKVGKNEHIYEFLRTFILESDTQQLVSLLKFATGHSIVTSLTDLKIKLELLEEDKVMFEAQACFSTLCLPVKHDSYDDFKKYAIVSLQYGCEGYGNL